MATEFINQVINLGEAWTHFGLQMLTLLLKIKDNFIYCTVYKGQLWLNMFKFGVYEVIIKAICFGICENERRHLLPSLKRQPTKAS